VNDRVALEKDRDLNFVFQIGFTLRYARGFVARPNRRGEGAQEHDPRVLALLFREHTEWAVGHNTSVKLPERDADGAVRALSTTQLPCYEVRSVEHEAVKGIETGMLRLCELDGEGLRRALTPLVDAYGQWIDRQRYEPLDRSELEKTRDTLIDEADRARARMLEGIQLLASDETVREAFKLANRAMHAAALQMDRTREDPRYAQGKQPGWRPFQLAFLLLNLASVARPWPCAAQDR
jgi:hypothetical protein